MVVFKTSPCPHCQGTSLAAVARRGVAPLLGELRRLDLAGGGHGHSSHGEEDHSRGLEHTLAAMTDTASVREHARGLAGNDGKEEEEEAVMKRRCAWRAAMKVS
jgi:hypothetical protein